MTLQIPRILDALAQMLLKEPLSRQMPVYQQERASLLASLRAQESAILKLRSQHKAKAIDLWTIQASLRDWVTYSDAHYFLNMAALYRRYRFDNEAKRVELMATAGSKKTTVTEDENGNIVSETVATGSTVGNAVELEF